MKDYRKELEALDEQRGRVHSLSDCSAAYRKSLAQPERLTENDFVLIGFVHGEKGVSEARMRQIKSFAAEAEAQRQISSGIPEETKSAETTPAPPPATLDEFLQRYGKKPVTYQALMKVLGDTDAVFVKELRALRQANKDLQNRVLELEALVASKVESLA